MSSKSYLAQKIIIIRFEYSIPNRTEQNRAEQVSTKIIFYYTICQSVLHHLFVRSHISYTFFLLFFGVVTFVFYVAQRRWINLKRKIEWNCFWIVDSCAKNDIAV